MYTILGKTYETFDEVIRFAWDTHRIDFDPHSDKTVDNMTEEDKQLACRELEAKLKTEI